MVQNYNSELSKEVVEAGKLQVNRDYPPNSFSDKIVYTCETNPKLLRRTNYVATASSTASAATNTIIASTLYSDKDLYITSASIGIAKDVANDAITGAIALNVTLNGVLSSLLSIPTLTLTAQSNTLSISFPNPIKVDRGTIISMTFPTFAAGLCSRRATITYYLDDNIKA